jgi:hypothetical protein
VSGRASWRASEVEERSGERAGDWNLSVSVEWRLNPELSVAVGSGAATREDNGASDTLPIDETLSCHLVVSPRI